MNSRERRSLGVAFSGHHFGAISHVIGPAFQFGRPALSGQGMTRPAMRE